MRHLPLVLLLAACSPGSVGPAGAVGEKGEPGIQGPTGPSVKIPHLVVASNHLDLGPSLGGNVALTEEGEVDFGRRYQLAYESNDCTGPAILDYGSAFPRASARFIGPDSTLLKVTGAQSHQVLVSSRRGEGGCIPHSPSPVDGYPYTDMSVVASVYKQSDLALELR